MKWNGKKDVCHDDKIVPACVEGQDMEKPRVVLDYNSWMGDMDLLTDKQSQHKEKVNIERTDIVLICI
jgi:hypothetical protein